MNVKPIDDQRGDSDWSHNYEIGYSNRRKGTHYTKFGLEVADSESIVGSLEPRQKLWYAVMVETMRVAFQKTSDEADKIYYNQSHTNTRDREIEEERNWLLYDTSTFPIICDLIGFNPERARDYIRLKMQKAGIIPS